MKSPNYVSFVNRFSNMNEEKSESTKEMFDGHSNIYLTSGNIRWKRRNKLELPCRASHEDGFVVLVVTTFANAAARFLVLMLRRRFSAVGTPIVSNYVLNDFLRNKVESSLNTEQPDY